MNSIKKSRSKPIKAIAIASIYFSSRPARQHSVAVFLAVLAIACFAFSHSGYAACPEICDGNNFNTGLGIAVFVRNPTGNENIAVGQNALQELTSGGENTAVGSGALTFNQIGSLNTAVGTSALAHNKVDGNTAVGAAAMISNSNGIQNAAFGASALFDNETGNSNTATGWGALSSNKIGSYNAATGAESLFNTTGEFNTGHGTRTLYTNSTGSSNTASGYAAMYNNTGGNFNTALGFDALSSNTTGSNNVAVGRSAGVNLTTGGNNIVIGANVLGKAGEANKIRIGKQGTQNGTFIAGIYNISEPAGGSVIKPVYIKSTGQLGTAPPASSARFKSNIKPMEKSSEAILALKPVSFEYKDDADHAPQFGLIAEEVAKAGPDLVVRDEQGEVYTVRYDAVNAMLVNEFLKEHRNVAEQQSTIVELKATVAKQQKQIETLTGIVRKVTERIDLERDCSAIDSERRRLRAKRR